MSTEDMIEHSVAACFGGTSGDVLFEAGDHRLLTRDLDEVYALGSEGVVAFSLITAGNECVGLMAENVPAHAPMASFVVSKDGRDVSVWLLDECYEPGDRLKALISLFSPEDEELYLPLPGTGGWLTKDNLDRCVRYSPSDLEIPADTSSTFNDATVHGDLDPALLEREIRYGGSRKGETTPRGLWKAYTSTVGALVKHLSTHGVGDKEGSCLLQGSPIDGARSAQSMRSLDLLMLDLDTGQDIDQILNRIRELGLFAVVWTTHSHMKNSTMVNKDQMLRWADGVEPTASLVSRYLIEEKRYRPEVLQDAKLVGTEHIGDGIKVRLNHKPMPKFRVLFVLKERFVFAERASMHKDAIQEWKERYAGISKMLGAFFDRSCVDPSRLFYLPRHDQGRPFRIDIIAGRPLDLDSVERVSGKEEASPWDLAASEMGAGASRDYKTPGLLQFFAKHGRVFDVETFLLEVDPDGDRGLRSNGPGRIHRCPNDHNHSDSGNQDDVGFYCVNGTESEYGATAKCMHDSCAKLDRVNFVDLACVAAKIDHASKLKKWVPELKEEGQEEEDTAPEDDADDEEDTAVERPFRREKDAVVEISKLTMDDTEGAAAIARRIGRSPKLTPVQRAGLISQISKASGVGKADLKQEIKAAQSAEATSNTYEDDDLITKLCAFNRVYAVCMNGGKAKVLWEERPGENPQMMSQDDFLLFTRNLTATVMSGNGDAKSEPLGKLWLEWKDRRTYNGITFDPSGKDPHRYNLWRGLAVKPALGEWDLLRDHIRDNVCRGNDDYYAWFMTWCAQLLQQPGRKLGSSIALRGKKGTGKSKVFDWLTKVFGSHAIKVSQRSQITGQFNSHQRGAVLMVCEEALWAGDASAGGVLKDLITSDKMMIEQKGVDPVEMPNYLRLVFISNEDWVVPAGLDDERRYFVLEVSDIRRGDTDYFAAIDAQMEHGGLEAMAHDLLAWKPPPGKGWDMLRKPPKTPWLVDQAVQGLDPWDRFFTRLLDDGGCSGNEREDLDEFDLNMDEPTPLPVRLLRGHYEAWLRGSGNTARYKIGNDRVYKDLVRRYLLVDSSESVHWGSHASVKGYRVPPLKDILEHHAKRGLTFD